METNISKWPDFYDPDLYENEIGPGDRVAEVYANLFSSSTCHRILEVGCGPGEIVIALAKRGHHVVGIDQAKGMTDRAIKRIDEVETAFKIRPEVVHCSLEQYKSNTLFDKVLLTNELPLHILTSSSLVSCFTTVFQALSEGGEVVLDIPSVNFQLLARASNELGEYEYCKGYYNLKDGTTLCVNEYVTFDPATWKKTMIFKYEQIDENANLSNTYFRKLVQRVWTVDEIRLALEIVGFSKISKIEFSGFSDRNYIRARR